MARTQEIVVVDIVIQDKGLADKLGKIKSETEGLKKANQDLKKELDLAFKENRAQDIQKISQEISRNEAQLKVLNTQYAQYQKQIQTATQAQNAAEGSYELLLRQYEDGVVALKTMQGTLVKNKDGTFQMSDAYRKAAEELKKKKDALDQFNKGVGDYRSLVGTYADAIKEAFGSTGEIGKQLGALGPAFGVVSQGAGLMKNGINGIGAAVKANPLGLITEAIRFFSELVKSNSGLLKIWEQAFAGIKAVVDGLTKILSSVFGIIKGIFTGDTDAIKENAKAIGDTASNIGTYAQKAADAKRRSQELSEAEREYKVEAAQVRNEIDKLIQSAKDRNLSEEERIKLLDEAGAKENAILAKELANAKERFDIAKQEADIAKATGKVSKEQKEELAQAETEYLKLVGESSKKQIEIERQKKEIILQVNQDIANGKRALIDAEIRLLESQGKDATKLRKDQAEQQFQQDVANAKGNQDLIVAAEKNKQATLNEIDKENRDERRAKAEEYNAKQKELQQELADSELLFIQDANQRAIAQIVLEGQRRIDEIKNTGEKEAQIKKAIELDIANQLNDVNKQIADENFAKAQDRIQKNAQATAQANLKARTDEENAIKLAVANKEITENEANIRRAENQKRYALEDLNLAAQTELQKAVILEDSIAEQKKLLLEQYESGKIEKTAYELELAEIEAQGVVSRVTLATETQAAVLNSEIAYQTALTDATIAGNQARTQSDEERAEALRKIQEENAKTAIAGIQAFATILQIGQDAQKKNAGLLKLLALAEVGINLQQEIQGYWAGAGKSTAQAGVYSAPFNAGLASAYTALAIARAAAAVAKITSAGKGFASGGYTGNGMFPADNTGFRVAGVVHEGEYVIPKWMTNNPQISPIVSSLEAMRINKKTMPFADGGFTSAFKLTQAIPQINEDTIVNAFDGALKKVTIVASASEITSTQTITTNIEQGATI